MTCKNPRPVILLPTFFSRMTLLSIFSISKEDLSDAEVQALSPCSVLVSRLNLLINLYVYVEKQSAYPPT